VREKSLFSIFNKNKTGKEKNEVDEMLDAH